MKSSLSFTKSLLFGAVLLCGQAASAHSGDAPSVAEVKEHLGDYESEIADMRDTAAKIVADYDKGEKVGKRVDALVETWEEVEFHEAVETHAMVLYPPIWTALGGLREAVDEDNAGEAVAEWQMRLNNALHEGVGALKLVASQPAPAAHGKDEATTSAAGDEPTIQIIKDNLAQVMERYRSGDSEGASALIHQTYMQRFEGIEGTLIESDADLVTDLEKDFNATLPLLIERSASADKLAAAVKSMNAKLDRAQKILDEAAANKPSVF